MKKLTPIALLALVTISSCSDPEMITKITKVKVNAFASQDNVAGVPVDWDEITPLSISGEENPDIFPVIIDAATGAEVWRLSGYEINKALDAENGDLIEFSITGVELEPTKTYTLQIYDFDEFTANDLMGAVDFIPSELSFGDAGVSAGSFNATITLVEVEKED